MARLSPGSRFAVSILSVTLVLVGLAAALAVRSYLSDRDRRIDDQERLAGNAALNAERFVSDRLDILSAIAVAPTVRDGDPAAMLPYFQSLDPASLGFVGGIGWTDATGVMRVFTDVSADSLPLDISDREHVKAVIATQQPFVGEAVIGRVRLTPILPFAVPTFDQSGVLSGVLIGTIRLDLLEAAAKEQRFGSSEITILDRSGNIIVQPAPVTELVNVASDPLLARTLQQESGVLVGVDGLRGSTNRVVSYALSPTAGWTVLIDSSKAELLSPARHSLQLELGGLAALGLIFGAGAIVSGRGIDRSGDREAAARVELALREARFRALTEATTNVIWTIAGDGEIRSPEERWSLLTGIPPDDLDQDEWLPYVHPDDRERGNAEWEKGIATGGMIEFEQRIRRRDGDERNVLVRAVPVRDENGKVREWIGVDIDVSHQRRAENALRARETFARDVINSLVVFVGVMTPDGTLIAANRAALEIADLTEADVLQRPFWEAYWWSYDAAVQEQLKDAIARAAAGEFVRYDVQLRQRGGRLMTIDFAIGAIRDEEGSIRFLVPSGTDVTERTRAERLVAASEERYRALVEATSTVVWRTTPAGELFFGGDEWTEITGQSLDDMKGWGWAEMIHPNDRDRAVAVWTAALASGEVYEDEFRIRDRSGDYRVFSVRGVPILDEDGSIREWVGANTDIHDRKLAEDVLRETAERLSLALEAGKLDTWDWDVAADSVVWAETAQRRLGPTPPTRDAFLDRIHPDDRQPVIEAIRKSLEEHAPYEVEYRIPNVFGSERWMYVRGQAFHDKDGRPLRMLGVNVDITDRRNREAFEQAFVANIAHDIKNPLAAVKAQAQLLRRRLHTGKADFETVDTVLGVLDTGLSRMNRRIEELADVARLRAGQQLELRKEPCNLENIVRGIVETYQQSTERHALSISTDDSELIGLWDTGRIERVVDNLVTNAIKYSPDGGPIAIRLERTVDERVWATMTVTDKGIGIPASDLPHVFERYRRAGNTAIISGSGIGLAGARQIVGQHRGSIDVVSQEGDGTTFIVRLPMWDPDQDLRDRRGRDSRDPRQE